MSTTRLPTVEGGKLGTLVNMIKDISFQQIVLLTVAIVFTRFIVRGIYRVYFHPLSRFSGPKLSAFTRIPHLYAVATGSPHRYIARLHAQYGDVVRISPDELSFLAPNAMRDVYGYGSKASEGSNPPKHLDRYIKPANGHDSLLTTANNVEHGRVRRIFSPAFSDRALTLQAPLFLKYVNKLIQTLKDRIEETKTGSAQVDMVKMYNFTTFDVMGDLTFGESLHMLDKGEFDSWTKLVFEQAKASTQLNCILHYYPLAAVMLKTILNRTFRKIASEEMNYSKTRVTKRLEKGRASEGVDIWDLVLGQEDKGKQGLRRENMDANASLFMAAGTETTATLLSGLTYFLLTNPDPMKKLKEEIRGTFASTDDMSMEALAKLPYLNACLKEGLRRYPPVPIGLPRITPANGSTICGEFVPPGTTVASHHTVIYSAPRNFKDPLSFVPERWTGDAEYAEDQRAVVQPFSIGARDCLGKNMAYHEMRLILSRVMYNFDLELCPESKDWNNQNTYIIWEKRPLMVKLTPAGTS